MVRAMVSTDWSAQGRGSVVTAAAGPEAAVAERQSDVTAFLGLELKHG